MIRILVGSFAQRESGTAWKKRDFCFVLQRCTKRGMALACVAVRLLWYGAAVESDAN